MSIMSPQCQFHEKSNHKNKAIFLGFLLSLLTITWHIFHCFIPIIIPLLLLLGISLPSFLHIRVPFVVNLISILWIIYYFVRKKVSVLWIRPSK